MKLKYSMLIIFALLIIDQVIKIIIQNALYYSGVDTINVIPNLFDLNYTQNFGISFSIFHGKVYFIILLTILGIALLVAILYKMRNDKIINILLSFMIAGAIGNFIDRIRLGYVVDYLSFHFGDYSFAIFNIADMYIVCAAFVMFIYVFFIAKDKYD